MGLITFGGFGGFGVFLWQWVSGSGLNQSSSEGTCWCFSLVFTRRRKSLFSLCLSEASKRCSEHHPRVPANKRRARQGRAFPALLLAHPESACCHSLALCPLFRRGNSIAAFSQAEKASDILFPSSWVQLVARPLWECFFRKLH